MSNILPTFLFKYKPIDSAEQLVNVLDIIDQKRIYAPKPAQLNDPLEGYGVVHTGHYAGNSISRALERQGKGINHSTELRVLSLTELPASPQMWAHYASGYKGICLAIETKDLPFIIEPVRYVDRPLTFTGDAVEDQYTTEEFSRASLFSKHIQWAYEQEWRGVFKEDETDSDGCVSLGSVGVCGVIIGSECNPLIFKYMNDKCQKSHIPVYKTYIAN